MTLLPPIHDNFSGFGFQNQQLNRPNTQNFKEKTQKIFGTVFKGERKRIAETLQIITDSLRDELQQRIQVGRKRVETILFTEVANREKEIKKINLTIQNLDSKVLELLTQNEQNIHYKLNEFEKIETDNKEKLYHAIKTMNEEARDDINKIAQDIDNKVNGIKTEQTGINSDIFNKFEKYKNQMNLIDKEHKKQSHSWRNAAELRFDEVLKLVKESVSQLREYRRKNDEDKNNYDKLLKELNSNLKVETGLRNGLEDHLKKQLAYTKTEINENVLKLVQSNEEKYKHQARRLNEESKTIKFLQEKIDGNHKDVDEKIKLEVLNREDCNSKAGI